MNVSSGPGTKGVVLAICLVLVSGWAGLLAHPSRDDLQAALRTAARLEREERWAEARDIYLEMGRLHPRDRSVLYGLERVHRNIDDDGRYLTFLRESFRRYPRDTLLFKYYLGSSVRAGEMDSIRPAVRLYMANRERSKTMYRSLHSIFLSLELYDLAEEVLLEGKKELGDPFLFSRELSDLYYGTGMYEQSLLEALGVLESSPAEMSFVTKRVEAIRNVLAGREIIERVEDYIGQLDDASLFLSLLSTLYVHEGKMDKALEALKELGEQDPETGIRELAGFAGVCEGMHAFKEGIEAYRLLGRLDPSRKIVFDLDAARLSRLNRRPKEARRIYRELLDISPDSLTLSQIYFSLGEIALYDDHHPEEAVEWFRRVADSGAGAERIAMVRIALMEALVFLGDMEAALEEEERAKVLDIEGDLAIEMEFFRGAVMVLTGRIKSGKEILKTVSRKTGHLRANDAIEVLTWLEKDSSTDFAVTRGLVELRIISRVEANKRSLRLLESLRKNAAKSPLAPDVIYCQAKTYRAAGRFKEAVVLLDEIGVSFPDHRLVPLAEWEAADILWHHLGELEGAKSYLERIILDHGDSIVTPKARKDLEELTR